MKDVLSSLSDIINSITIGPVPQLFLNTVFSGGIFYFIQRKHKRNDDFIIEKNKRIVEKHVDFESQLFHLMNTVKIGNINDQICIDLYTRIKNFTILNYLYISDDLLKISNEFADYLLEISINITTRDRELENKLIKKFKSEFKK
ncbi:hypothetical protein [Flavobacterium sp. HTF]|uniref:hypothetical protein n=1 Tax=Flavobacterium sp. HTF TaxID=2170732 RepID=UPI000D5F01A2|nr:hypothetical protein [Flavobacterium sp. HTF]PWB20684.1 hypothetical protein DCO46_20385 [Flavobacterium sp. HTF]